MPAGTVKSKVSYARKDSRSLKTTVPEGVADALKLAHCDSLERALEIREGRIIAEVRRAP